MILNGAVEYTTALQMLYAGIDIAELAFDADHLLLQAAYVKDGVQCSTHDHSWTLVPSGLITPSIQYHRSDPNYTTTVYAQADTRGIDASHSPICRCAV